MFEPLPVSSPADQGVDARGVLAFLDAVEARAGLEPHGITIVRHGHEVAAGAWAPYRRDRPRLLYSLSKSFTSTAVGLAVAEGLLTVDDLVLDHFPEYADDAADDRVRSWRVRHMLTMSSGHTSDTADRIMGTGEDPVREFLRLAPEREPGSVFSYNQGCTHTAAAIVQRLVGCTLPEYLQPRLFDAVGGGPVTWLEKPPGRSLGFSGLHATHDDVVKLGLLYLQRGRFGDRQVLPEAWVELATSRQIGTPGEPNPDWQQGYGFQFWIGRHGYRGDGAFGQFCLVLPESDTLVVITSATLGMQGVLDEVYRHLLPALHDAPLQDATSVDAELAARLDGLTLAAPANALPPADPDRWTGVTFAPRGGVCRVQPSLTGARLDHDVAGGTWRVTLVEGDSSFTVTVTVRRAWVAEDAAVIPGGGTVPVAASGALTERGEFRIEIRFLETPHTFVLILDPLARTFRALWPTVPLHGLPLRHLRAPR